MVWLVVVFVVVVEGIDYGGVIWVVGDVGDFVW